MVGDTYTILVSGDQTDGHYCLIDMLVPDGSGPPPHRHDFEEMFSLLEGELEFTFRGKSQTVKAPTTVNIPANAPHVFKNTKGGGGRKGEEGRLCPDLDAGEVRAPGHRPPDDRAW